jgi:hypothetical protein
LCEDAVEVGIDFVFELGGCFFRSLSNFLGIAEAEEAVGGWVGEIVLWGGGCYCAGNTPAAELGGEVGAEGFVLLVVWREDGPGGAGRDRGGLVECR